MKNIPARFKAWLVHLLISVCVLLPVLFLIFYWWFPHPFFEVQSAGQVVAVLVGIQLIFGPLLTFLVYVPKKKGLVFDLVVIALLQTAALAFGVYSIHSERPAFVVFAVDRYVPVASKDLNLAGSGFGHPALKGQGAGFSGKPFYVFAEVPLGEAFDALQDGVLFGGQPDLEYRPEFWLPLDQGRPAIELRKRPVSELLDQRPESKEALSAAVERLGLKPGEVYFLPLVGKKDDYAAIIDPETGYVIEAVAVKDPWIK